jgi:hypothetical protein
MESYVPRFQYARDDNDDDDSHYHGMSPFTTAYSSNFETVYKEHNEQTAAV